MVGARGFPCGGRRQGGPAHRATRAELGQHACTFKQRGFVQAQLVMERLQKVHLPKFLLQYNG